LLTNFFTDSLPALAKVPYRFINCAADHNPAIGIGQPVSCIIKTAFYLIFIFGTGIRVNFIFNKLFKKETSGKCVTIDEAIKYGRPCWIRLL
jgi:hypothetical protein